MTTYNKPLGTPLSPAATRVMLLGSGELGKEVLIALVDLQNQDNGGTIRISNNVILDFVSGTLSPTVGWIVMSVGVVLFGVVSFLRDRRRRASGLATPPLALTALKVAITAVAG